jgi:hypothetical protein
MREVLPLSSLLSLLFLFTFLKEFSISAGMHAC